MSMHTSSSSSSPSKSRARPDAIQLLKADHREAEELFAKFEKARTAASKRKIADEVCNALKVHTTIEEELFYPACEAAGVEQELLDEPKVEHEGAKTLIEEILAGDPGDELWEAKVKVLQEQIEHHVKEEEEKEGIFAQAKKADLDLAALGRAMAERKAELA